MGLEEKESVVYFGLHPLRRQSDPMLSRETVKTLRKTRHRRVRRVGWMFSFALAVHNPVRLRILTWLPAVA